MFLARPTTRTSALVVSLVVASGSALSCAPSPPPGPPPKTHVVASSHGIALPRGAVARLGIPELGKAMALARSADQRVLAIGSSAGVLRLYRLARDGNGRLLRVEPARTFFDHSTVSQIELSRDGKLVAAAGAAGEDIVVRDVDSGALLHRLIFDSGRLHRETGAPIKEPVTALAFSHDGRLLAAGGEALEAPVWSVADGQPRAPLSVRQKTAKEKQCERPIDEQGRIVDRRKLGCDRASPHVTALWFAADGKSAYARVGEGDAVSKHTVKSGERVGTLRCAPGKACEAKVELRYSERLKIAGAGRLLHITSQADVRAPHSTVVLWPEQWAGKRARYSSPVTRLLFSPDGSLLQSRTRRGELRLWHVAKAKLHHDYGKPTKGAALPYGAATTLMIDGDSKRPATLSHAVWAAAKKLLAAREKENPCLGADCQRPYARAVQHVAVWPPSGAVAAADRQGLYLSTLKAPLRIKLGAVLGFVANGAQVAVATVRHAVMLCATAPKIKGGRCEPEIAGLPTEARRVAASARGGRFAATGVGGHLLLARRGGADKPQLYHPSSRITALAVASDGSRVAVALADGTILLYR